ncbi:hypothetical protein ACFFJB_03845 [Camelimonas abortus]
MLLLSGGLVSAAQGAVLLYFWRKKPAASYLAWWAASFLVGGVLRILVELLPYSFDERNFLGILVIMLAYGMSWQGVRTFGGRPVVLPMVFLPPACWIVIGFSGLFDNGSVAQLRAVCFLYAFTWAVSAFEFVRARGVSLPARMPMILLCAATALAYVARIFITPYAPYPIGAAPSADWAYSSLFFISIITTIAFGTFALALAREHASAAERKRREAVDRHHIRSRSTFFANVRLLLRRHRARNEPVAMAFIHVDMGRSGAPDAVAFEKVLRRFEGSVKAVDQFSIVGRAELAAVLCRRTAADALDHFQGVVAGLDGVCREQGWKISIGVASTEQVGHDVNALIDAAWGALAAARSRDDRVAIYRPGMSRRMAEAPVNNVVSLAATR